MAKMLDESENIVSGIFECNICLDAVQEPVVTLCGHLYCWPCIYKWIQHQETSSETLENQNATCPICKTEVSEKTIVPLYGPNQTTNKGTSEKGLTVGLAVPPRPGTPTYHGYQRHALSCLYVPAARGDMSTDCAVAHSPTIGMLREMVSGRLLGNLESPLFGTPNSYNQVGINTRRERWQTAQVDTSLSRIYVFLCCFTIFCLIMFT